MSRVAKQPISLPKGVEMTVGNDEISVKGPKGTLSVHHLPGVTVVVDNGVAQISLNEGADDKFGGTARALLANMVTGVSTGYERKLELVGVGYRVSMAGKSLSLRRRKASASKPRRRPRS
jgi:large subunit ribosomal protein L6